MMPSGTSKKVWLEENIKRGDMGSPKVGIDIDHFFLTKEGAPKDLWSHSREREAKGNPIQKQPTNEILASHACTQDTYLWLIWIMTPQFLL